MIVEMRKLKLAAPRYERDALLSALTDTGAVEIKEAETQASPLPVNTEALEERLSALESALQTLVSEAESYSKAHKEKSEIPEDGFEVSYTEFISAYRYHEEAEEIKERVNALTKEKAELNAALLKAERGLKTAQSYAFLREPFSAFRATRFTRVELGVLPSSAIDDVATQLSEKPLIAFTPLFKCAEGTVILCVSHITAAKESEAVLRGKGFTPCPFAGEETGEEVYARYLNEKTEITQKIKETERAFFVLGKKAKLLKLYCDYLGMELEKETCSKKMRATAYTFLMEAYIPKGAEEEIRAAISSASGAAYFSFADLEATETPPTLLKNNAVIENFETVTNMYSPPSSREFDPNTIMSVFYSIFLGFIMADMGYGLIMLIAGGLIWYKNRARKGGLKSLAGVFAVGGVLAIFWGILFNSLCGIAVLPFTVMPNAQSDMWKFVGISVPSVLIIALMLGVVQLMTGYICRAVQCFRWGRAWDGLLDGATWALFSVGVELAIVGLVEEFYLSYLTLPGGIMAGVALAVAACTAGRKEKALGKFTKGFGALYGVINYVSDILSYARLYGLMLSGAVIAQIVSQYSVQFILSGGVIAVFGVLLMVVGHGFNLAISLLGAYIHDARLQYVEFYGRFYVGEGELFTPLGATHKYVTVRRESEKTGVKASVKEAA